MLSCDSILFRKRAKNIYGKEILQGSSKIRSKREKTFSESGKLPISAST